MDVIPKMVLDTNVLVAALRSRRGASYAIVLRIGQGDFDLVLSVPVFLEYEEVLKRSDHQLIFDEAQVEQFLNYLCSEAEQCRINYLWRPRLKDADDDMVLELAIASGATHIVTHNVSDFEGHNWPSITVLTPKGFLDLLRGNP